MRCGFYEMDITPHLGENIPGYFEARPASGIRDQLYCKAAAFESSSGEAFLLIVMDTISTDISVSARAKQRLNHLTGIPQEKIMLAATHTHTGGPVDNFVPNTMNEEYLLWLADRAADTGYMAWQRREAAMMAFDVSEESGISFNRRYRMIDGSIRTNPGFDAEAIAAPLGAIDPEIGIMKIVRSNGELMAVICNFACHLDTVGGNRFSADYPGEISRVLKRVYGSNVVSLFLTGACGNINHLDFMHRSSSYYQESQPAYYVRMGRILAGSIIRTLSQMDTYTSEAIIDCVCSSFDAQVRQPNEDDIREAKKYLSEHPYVTVISSEENPSTCLDDLPSRHFARSLLEAAEKQEMVLSIPVQAARIGDVLIAGMPCELFVEFGLDLKARDGFKHTMISTLTNAHFGYIATKEAFSQGGYETRFSGDTKMEQQTGYDLIEETLKLADQLK